MFSGIESACGKLGLAYKLSAPLVSDACSDVVSALRSEEAVLAYWCWFSVVAEVVVGLWADGIERVEDVIVGLQWIAGTLVGNVNGEERVEGSCYAVEAWTIESAGELLMIEAGRDEVKKLEDKPEVSVPTKPIKKVKGFSTNEQL